MDQVDPDQCTTQFIVFEAPRLDFYRPPVFVEAAGRSR